MSCNCFFDLQGDDSDEGQRGSSGLPVSACFVFKMQPCVWRFEAAVMISDDALGGGWWKVRGSLTGRSKYVVEVVKCGKPAVERTVSVNKGQPSLLGAYRPKSFCPTSQNSFQVHARAQPALSDGVRG